MGRIIWDGQKIVVDSVRMNVEALKHLCEKYNGEHLPVSPFYEFPRSVQLVKEIAALDNAVLDESFNKIYKAVLKAEESKKARIENYNFPEMMYPFQKEAVAKMLESDRNILLASDPGCGKTCMSCIFLSKSNLYPALVICPASLKVNWQVEIEKWSPNVKTIIVNGRDSYADSRFVSEAKKADVVIINYDILGAEDREAMQREKERIAEAKENGWKYRKAFIPTKGWAVEFQKFNFKTIVADECQYIESAKAIRTRATIQVCDDKRIKKLFLSGTPFETKVRQFYNTCHILAPDLFPSESNFLFTYCNPIKGYFGWTFDGLSNGDELRKKLSLFMIRHRKEDVLKQLPKKQNIPVYFDMSNKARRSYDEMEEELLSKKDGMQQFTYLAEMKKALFEIKKDVVVQYIKDMLDVEEKIVVFTYHTELFDLLMEKFKECAVGINGSVANFKRQDMVNKFQKDKKVRLFVGQIQAASVGLTLTASHTVVFTEWGQTIAQHIQGMDRTHRIGQEADICTAYYLIVKDTIDEAPMKTLNNHNKDIQAVLNGEKNATFLDINDVMLAAVKERVLMRKKKGVHIEYS